MKLMQFGNSILRQTAQKLTVEEVTSDNVQDLIVDIRDFLITKKLGVGLAAPQIGKDIALSVIAIRQSKRRPNVQPLDLVIINPEIIEASGRRSQLYEGCLSGGSGKAGLFAKVPRYKKLKLRYLDEKAKLQEKWFEGLPAHVIQHEVDHLNGILFVDRVTDTKSYMTQSEYVKFVKAKHG